MKIGIYGNCQTRSFEKCLKIRLPDVEIVSRTSDETLEELRECDVIMQQTDYWDGHLADLKKSGSAQFIKIPTFYFPGLHPDLVIERDEQGTVLMGPAGSYNSSLVIYGFLSGLSVAKTLQLFDERVYQAVGFYSYWDIAKVHAQKDLDACGLDGNAVFAQWEESGRFAHSVNHPTVMAVQAMVDALLRKTSLRPKVSSDEADDPLLLHGRWPVYPEIASRIGLVGDYDFRFGPLNSETNERGSIDLETFVLKSFEMYETRHSGSITSKRVNDNPAYRDLEKIVSRPVRRRHVYSDLPDYAYWKRAISECPANDVDPVINTKFLIKPSDRVATGGSCFAQHIARTLVARGFNYYVAEQAPNEQSSEWAAARGYGMFSARYGNIYTARQLRQLVDRCTGDFHPVDEAWRRPDDRLVDPFRPQIEPEGYGNIEALRVDVSEHLAHTNRMFRTTDVFVFTLGLTECWTSKIDGAAFPIAPGIIAGAMDQEKYQFSNLSCAETVDDLNYCIRRLRILNPDLKFLITVSPVPLVATYEKQHVLVSTILSKSILRTAADEVCRSYDFVDYFPSYEIITGTFNRGEYFETDRRSVNEDGVDHVMRILTKHYFKTNDSRTSTQLQTSSLSKTVQESSLLANEMSRNSKILCDEELLGKPDHDLT